MKVFLTGFMGAGKTALGKQLAEALEYAFIDTDQLIEEQQQATIPQLFEERGENAFRDLETQALHSLAGEENCIVATGGGLPCYNDNMLWMNNNGLTIYIKQDIDELFNRLKTQKNMRPLIKSLPDRHLRPFIQGLLDKRVPFYTRSKYVFSGPVVSPETVINTTLL